MVARSLRDLVKLLDDLGKAGVVFRSATEPFDTATPAGRMVVQMLGVFAEFERATIIDRIVAGMERKAAREEWQNGCRPHGYLVDKTTGYLVVNDLEAPLSARSSTSTPSASWEIARRLLEPGEDALAFTFDVVRRLRDLETLDRDWPRGEVERLHEEFAGSVLSTTMIDCRESLVSPGQAKAALRSVELPKKITPLREILKPHEYALFRLARRSIVSIDMRLGTDPAIGRWDPYRPSEVLAAPLQLIEHAVTQAADSLPVQLE